jgi:hypothetical protein
LGILLVGRRSTLGVRAQRGSLTGDLGWQVHVGEERKKGEGREGADAWDRPGRGRKGERRERSGWTARRAKGTEGAGPRCGPCGEGRKGKRGRWPTGRKCRPKEIWAAFFSSSFPFLFPHLNYSNESI